MLTVKLKVRITTIWCNFKSISLPFTWSFISCLSCLICDLFKTCVQPQTSQYFGGNDNAASVLEFIFYSVRSWLLPNRPLSMSPIVSIPARGCERRPGHGRVSGTTPDQMVLSRRGQVLLWIMRWIHGIINPREDTDWARYDTITTY